MWGFAGLLAVQMRLVQDCNIKLYDKRISQSNVGLLLLTGGSLLNCLRSPAPAAVQALQGAPLASTAAVSACPVNTSSTVCAAFLVTEDRTQSPGSGTLDWVSAVPESTRSSQQPESLYRFTHTPKM